MKILMKAKHIMIKIYKNISKMLVLKVYKEQKFVRALEEQELIQAFKVKEEWEVKGE